MLSVFLSLRPAGSSGRVDYRGRPSNTVSFDELMHAVPDTRASGVRLEASLSSVRPVLLVGDQFHPIGILAVLDVGDRDVAHAVGVGCAMPVLDPDRDPHDVDGRDLLARLTFALDYPSRRQSSRAFNLVVEALRHRG